MCHRFNFALLLLVCVIGFSTITGLAQQKPMPDPVEQNAVLQYWQAFAVMPNLSDAEKKLRDEIRCGDRPVDAEARKLIRQSGYALRRLHQGAKMERAAWGLAWEEGPFVSMPHISKARELVRFVDFRAYVRFEDGEHDKAIEDLLAAMTLGRHLAKEGVITFIPLLVDHSIESICLQSLAEYVPQMDPQTRAELKRRLASLPELRSLTDAMQGEKDVYLTWLMAEVKKPNPKQRVLDLLENISENDEAKAFKKLDDSEMLPAARRMGAYFDRMIEMVKLPPKEMLRQHDQLFQEIKTNGAKDFVSYWLLPAAAQARAAEVRHLTRLALFQAGLAIVEQGEKALKNPEHKDPFGDGPFAYQETDTGFVLTSNWELAPGRKLSLTFGKK